MEFRNIIYLTLIASVLVIVTVAYSSYVEVSFTLTPSNATYILVNPPQLNLSAARATLILINPSLQYVEGLALNPGASLVSQFQGLLIMSNGSTAIVEGIIKASYVNKPINAEYFEIFITYMNALGNSGRQPNSSKSAPAASSINGTYINGTSIMQGEYYGDENALEYDYYWRQYENPVGPPYISSLRNVAGAARATTGAVKANSTIVEAQLNNRVTTVISLTSLAIIAFALAIMAVVEVVPRQRSDCVVSGFSRIINRINNKLYVYRADITHRDLERYILYYTNDLDLVRSFLKMYEEHVYGGRAINCREYGRLVKRLLKLIK